jgi:hypothetical protein
MAEIWYDSLCGVMVDGSAAYVDVSGDGATMQNLGMPFTAAGTITRGNIVSLTPSGVVAGFGMQL